MSINNKRNFFFFSLAGLAILILAACAPKVYLTTIKKAETSTYKYAQVEPSICINPANPREIIAGTVLNDFYFSTDRGNTWQAQSLRSPFGVNGDPVLLVDHVGYYYYFHLSKPSKDESLDRIVCQRTSSLNQAPMETVGHTEVNGKAHDKHWAVIDPVSRTIHMAWTQFDKYDSKNPSDSSVIVYAQSKDFGITWTETKRISKLAGNCKDDSGTIEGVSICLGFQSEIYVAYCLNSKIYLNVSFDNGKNWLARDREIAMQPGGWDFQIPGIYRTNGFPSLQMDLSDSDYRGRLFLSWCDQRNGASNTDVWISHSDDQGLTWSDIKKVNNDYGSRHQFLSTMRVDPKTGTIVTLFYDRRDHLDNATNVYMAYSKDGGQTFKNFKISKVPFTPNADVFFGDYLAVDVRDNIAHAMWPEMRNGKISLKYARIDLNERMKSDARSKM